MFLFYILFFLVEIDGKTFVKDGFSVIAKSNLHASGVKNGFWDSLLRIIRKSKNKLRSYDVLQESIFRHLYMKYATYQNSNCSGKLCLPNHLSEKVIEVQEKSLDELLQWVTRKFLVANPEKCYSSEACR